MSIMLTATFDTRREAEMTVERLVQEFGLDRALIFVTAEGDENTAGEEIAGADVDTPDAALNGAVVVTVEVTDDAQAEKVRDAFSEFHAAGVVEVEPARAG